MPERLFDEEKLEIIYVHLFGSIDPPHTEVLTEFIKDSIRQAVREVCLELENNMGYDRRAFELSKKIQERYGIKEANYGK